MLSSADDCEALAFKHRIILLGPRQFFFKRRRLGVRHYLQNVGGVRHHNNFGGFGVYNKLFGKVGMGALRTGNKSLFEAVEGVECFGVEDYFLSTLTAGSERV